MAFDWVEAAASTDRLAQATMAAFTIKVNGKAVTSVLDRRSRSCRDHVVTPLAYVAEWLVGNWWRLFCEVEDERVPRGDFAEAHNLAFVGEGFLLPRLTITPTPERMRLRWTPYRPRHSDIEFVEQGEAHVDQQDLQDAAQGIVEATLDRLDGLGVTAEVLQRDWAAIQSADGDERAFCRAAALFGQDPFAVPQALADQIVDFWDCAEPTLREDALATANGGGLAELGAWLADALDRLRSSAAGADWADIRSALHTNSPAQPAAQPYRRGYDLAQAVRAQLARPADRYDFAEAGPEALSFVEVDSPNAGIQGLVAAHGPACASAAHGRARRFLQARALGDYLGRSTDGPAILSGLATDRQAQSRAFAADFLVPAAALRRHLGNSHIHPDELEDLAAHFDVSSYVVRHQIENHRLAHITDW